MFHSSYNASMFNLENVQKLAREHRVGRLGLFGSAARRVEIPGNYHFLVEFEPMPPLEHGRMYLSLLSALERLCESKVDLLELEALENHYFIAAIEPDRKVLYFPTQKLRKIPSSTSSPTLRPVTSLSAESASSSS